MSGKNKTLRAIVICAILSVLIIPLKANAVIVSRTDLWCEKTIAALQLENLNYVQEVLTNLEGVEAIRSIKTLISNINDIIDFKEDLEDLDGSISDITRSAFEGIRLGKSSVEDFSNAINTGEYKGKKVDGGLLGDINETVGDGADNTPLNEVLVAGGIDGNAGSIAVDRAYNALLVEYGLSDEKKTGTDDGKDTGKTNSDDENVEEVVNEALKLGVETVPMSFPTVQRSVTDIIGATDSTLFEKSVYSGNIADASRTYALSSITSTMAPYMLKEGKGSYREIINKIEEQSKKSLAKTEELSNGGPSQALRTIAGLSAVQVEQSALQNQLLITMIDVMADEIKMMGINAMLNVEGYAQGMSENMLRYIEVQERISIGE